MVVVTAHQEDLMVVRLKQAALAFVLRVSMVQGLERRRSLMVAKTVQEAGIRAAQVGQAAQTPVLRVSMVRLMA